MAPVKIRHGFRHEPAPRDTAGALIVGTLVASIAVVIFAIAGVFG
jgi:hypothetical protein